MTTAFDEIRELLLPPDSPCGLDRSWADVELDIGLSLPEDYKSFIDVYGSGQITGSEGWINFWNFRDTSMFKPALSTTLCGPNSVIHAYQRLDSTEYPCPYPVYPATDGLLPFASVNDVENLNWLTSGSPSQWPVVYYFFDGCEFTLLENDSFSQCVLKILANEYTGLEQPSSLEPPLEFTDFRMR